ncbi:cathepsin O isoform X2 [Leptinotarsa decemlineata]|uniref:cathepsin O isoform X2 n=1 Tax=Leptinotarsa decemlineata TaxID=7539 RepID=UPI000C2517C7|nr:cathepsin O-like isoform X2 [Leptinotarsa decemlineata]
MPNCAETPRARRIRIFLETTLYVILLCIIIPIRINHDAEQFEKYLKTSLRAIDLLNANRTDESAKYGLTKYSDLLPEEFVKTKLLPEKDYLTHIHDPSPVSKSPISKRSTKYNLPKRVDWRERNAVSGIQSQGTCGACWAFSVIGVVESMIALKTGKLEKLSVQQMIDCSMYNDGCDGGDICSLLKWIKTESVSIVEETHYPLSLTKQECKNVSGIDGILIDGFECDSFVNDEEIILAFLAKHGPVAVAINARSWQHYVGGIIQFHCESSPLKLNHAVQIVGYDLTANIPHYIVKNSWGEDFGEDGYLYIAIGKNLCGLAHEVSAVKVL